ncbi:MAG: hypothetical protein AB7S26_42150 [Sandaracinaceae bacterium]
MQLLLLCAVVALVTERVRTLAFRAPIDVPPFRRAIVRLARRRDKETLLALVRDALPAWPATCVIPLVDPAHPQDEVDVDVEERLMDVEELATRGMRSLRASATIASGLGFIGAAIQIWWIWSGEHGLAALEAGRVESVGIARAVLSIALGLAGSSLALGSWTVLRNAARDRISECRRVVSSLEDAMTKAPLDSPVETADGEGADP